MTLLLKKNDLEVRIKIKKARIGVIGLGYVGLPLALTYIDKGFKVLGLDSNVNKLNLLSNGKSYIKDVPDQVIKEALLKEKIQFSSDMALISECDVIVVCVPTPLKEQTKEPDLSYIREVVKQLIQFSRPNQLLILESTTNPGTTRKEVAEKIASRSELKIGENYFVTYSPERIDPGNQNYKVYEIPKVIGGMTKECLRYGELFYSSVVKKVHCVSSPEIAETAKLLENTYRYINLAFINEMALHCRELNIDIWEVIDASSTKPFGFQKFYPGPGVGGHCIPVDPIYFKWVANNLNLKTELIDLAIEINTRIPELIVQKTKELIREPSGKVLIVGMAYKKNVNDYRESPALDILEKLSSAGIHTDYYDPLIGNIQLTKEGEAIQSVLLNKDSLTMYDIIIIHTDHDEINYKLLENTKATIIDTRNVLRRKNIKPLNLVNL
ncbi:MULTISPECIES: nucleotide sugar dehydrogenase [Virgibacillus]|uniref:UDP-N-acetyl-D-glucosamine 6-dehydrogenase n=1 Tax=Virgibacillus dokdonensis TaxID=302167 RepID=A0A2K9IYV3_9BACI|nr:MULTISPECIES: nucleotide sugar dehydrogenase [Virgibacillus]AUJ24836.1 UDP-N-acetyl-D-glucosamine 6-dehydrogenase [Virgibacillus dokdonensis]NWO14498.1 nucleotide sugar dehydrogenase [Virgibacillus sp.]